MRHPSLYVCSTSTVGAYQRHLNLVLTMPPLMTNATCLSTDQENPGVQPLPVAHFVWEHDSDDVSVVPKSQGRER
jgi:hypothetical protein